jgi:nucleotide-binding universal stress UspA family protein
MPCASLGHVVIAWSNTREATRAIAEAMPFLHAAISVEIVSIETKEEGAGAMRCADLAAHLDRHGIPVTVSPMVEPKRSVGEALLERAERSAADLVVMGGYGHSRLREWIIGGTTRDMLRQVDIPLLLAH